MRALKWACGCEKWEGLLVAGADAAAVGQARTVLPRLLADMGNRIIITQTLFLNLTISSSVSRRLIYLHSWELIYQ